MSYFQVAPIGNSQGINFDQFLPGTSNPMIPQEMYRPEAMGPQFLAMDGLGALEDIPKPILIVGGLALFAMVALALSGQSAGRAF